MPFNSFSFILLTAGCIFIAFKLHKVHRLAPQIFITLVSLSFYALWNVRDIFVLLLSLAANYGFARSLAPSNARKRHWLFGVSIMANIGLLAWYKFGHLLPIAEGLSLTDRMGDVPLGLSFFTFQQIAYLTTIYKGAPVLKLRDYAFVVCFFPHLVAGPLVRHSDIVDQLKHPATFRPKALNLFAGMSLFAIGLAKKVLISDALLHFFKPMMGVVDAGKNLDTGAAWATANAHALHIYFDFSAYSDMACGIAIMLGIRLPLNFFSPLKATNMDMFWNRWNITVTSFIRDHVFRPLAGKRLVAWRHLLALPITMIVAGVWHGSSWNYLLWGVLHGLLVMYDHGKILLFRGRRVDRSNSSGRFRTLVGWFRTQLLVIFLGCVFGTTTLAGAYTLIKSMLIPTAPKYTLPITQLPGIFQALPWPTQAFSDARLAELQMIILILVTWVIVLCAPNSVQMMQTYRAFTDRTRLLTRLQEGSTPTWLRRLATPNVLWFAFIAILLTLCFLQMVASAPIPFNYYKH